MSQKFFLFSRILTGVCALLSLAGTAQSLKEPEALRVSKNGRYLQQADGRPFLWLGDTAWALFYKLNREEVRAYLDDRQNKGFSVIQAVAYWYPHGEDGPGPHNAANAYGHRPFEGADDSPDTAKPLVRSGGSADAPNDYWDHADFVIREIRQRGMYVALLPCWGRAYVNGIMPKSRPNLEDATARSYVRFLGQRYRHEPHLIWVIGGDVNPLKGVGDRRSAYRAMAEGIALGALGLDLRWNEPGAGWDRILISYHPDGDPSSGSSRFFHQEPWLDVNGLQTWASIDKVLSAIGVNVSITNPVKPVLFLEGAYEGGRYPEPGARITDLKVRRQAWQAMLAGAAGHTYGASAIWQFQRKPRETIPANNWREALKLPAAAQTASVMRQILVEHRWWDLVPDQSLILDGASQRDLVKASARSADGKRILVYFPDATPARLRLPSNSVEATWIRPDSGQSVKASGSSNAEFMPPEEWDDSLLSFRSQEVER